MKTDKWVMVAVAVVLLVVLTGIVAACGGGKPAEESTSTSSTSSTSSTEPPSLTLDIGVSASLTGPTQALGTQLKNGALLAIEDQNARGGVTIAGERYGLNPIVLDNKGEIAAGKTVAEQMVYDKHVKVVVGGGVADAISSQAVTEPNKVFTLDLQPIISTMAGPDKPYTYFLMGPIRQLYDNVTQYVAKFYPEAKTVVSVMPDLPDTPTFLDPAKMMCQRYGLTWVRSVFFPLSTTDFAPMISKILEGNPDIIDTGSTGGSAGALCVVLIKQLREAGFDGPIIVPASPDAKALTEVLPEQYRTKIITTDLDPRSSSLPASYGELFDRFAAKFASEPPTNVTVKMYNAMSGFLQFLDGQPTMDTTAWAAGFTTFTWQSPWGEESFMAGQPIYGTNHSVFGTSWVSEWKDGALETKWQATYDLKLYTNATQ